jgi:hypothetical protein
VLELAGIVLLVVLVLVGALMPLKYTARMQLPKRTSDGRAEAPPPPGPEPTKGER